MAKPSIGQRWSRFWSSMFETLHCKTPEMPQIIISSGSGQVGAKVAKEVKRRFPEVELRAGVTEAMDDNKAEDRLQGMQVVKVPFDATKPDTLKSALRGLRNARVLIIPPPADDRAEQVQRMLEACKQARVKFVCILSIPGGTINGLPQATFARQYRKIESDTIKSRIPGCILRIPFFSENQFFNAGSIMLENTLIGPVSGNAAFPYVTLDDVARVCAEVLRHPRRHMGKTYTLTGPNPVTHDRLAQYFSEMLQKKIQYEQIDIKEYQNILVESGVPEWQSVGICELFQSIEKGDQAPEVTRDIERITSRAPVDMQRWIRDVFTPSVIAG